MLSLLVFIFLCFLALLHFQLWPFVRTVTLRNRNAVEVWEGT